MECAIRDRSLLKSTVQVISTQDRQILQKIGNHTLACQRLYDGISQEDWEEVYMQFNDDKFKVITSMEFCSYFTIGLWF